MTKRRVGVLTVVLALLVAVAMLYSPSPSLGSLQRVPSDHVCMVNDTHFPASQIPVPVGGKTYFGCCDMCKGRLASDAIVRSAVDPFSGNRVDKATAVIGALPSGKVLYFESESNLDAYQSAL